MRLVCQRLVFACLRLSHRRSRARAAHAHHAHHGRVAHANHALRAHSPHGTRPTSTILPSSCSMRLTVVPLSTVSYVEVVKGEGGHIQGSMMGLQGCGSPSKHAADRRQVEEERRVEEGTYICSRNRGHTPNRIWEKVLRANLVERGKRCGELCITKCKDARGKTVFSRMAAPKVP